MGRESRSFYRRVMILGVSIPLLRFAWNRREWFERLEYTPEHEAEALADSTKNKNLRLFSPFIKNDNENKKTSSTTSSSSSSFIPLDVTKVTADFSASTASKEHFAQKIRANQIGKLEDAEVDVLVIGGGATGLFAALDATTRGLKVALVEQSDFGSGVTGTYTSLLHSGFKRAQAAIRQRDYRQIAQLMQDAGELRSLERCTTINNDMKNNNDTSPRPLPLVNRMPTLFPMASMTEIVEFCLCTLIFSTFTVLGGGLLPIARPVMSRKILNEFSEIQESETNEMTGGFLIPERKLDGFALARSIAHTATEHGACVLNYARVIGLDCEEQQPRTSKSVFNGVSGGELERRSMDVDGQPYPWFDTGINTDYFMDEKVAKPTETEDEGSNYFVSGAKERFLPERLKDKEADRAKLGLLREEDLPFYSVHAAVVRDELSGKVFRIYPKYVLNCTGRWGDSIRRMFPIAQPQMFERWSAQFFVVGHHQDPRSEALQKKQEAGGGGGNNNVQRPALISPRNHVDAKPLFVYPYNMNSAPTSSSSSSSSSSETQPNEIEKNVSHRWSLIGPVDSTIDAADPYFASPEKHFVITGDPAKQSPSLWRELRSPRITPTDLAFIATAADIFGVHIDSGFTLVQPRVLCESWPGGHPSLCRALRFGGAVDYRTMHQKIVHSVGTETVWSRKKAELMVDSYFIEAARNAENKVKIPPCRTKKLVLVASAGAGQTKSTVAVAAAGAGNDANSQSSSDFVLPLTKMSEKDIRSWARFDGCATILDVLLRRKQDLFSSFVVVTENDDANKNSKSHQKTAYFLSAAAAKARETEIKKIGEILSQEWNWSKDRLKSEIESASSYFERNSFAAEK